MIRAALPHELEGDVLQRIEAKAVEKARAVMTARRFLDFEGPLGGGIESLQVGHVHDTELGTSGAKISTRRAIPIPTLYASFELPRREVEGAIMPGLPLDTYPAEDAAERVALAEEHLLYHGMPEIGLEGVVTHTGSVRIALGDWTTPDGAIGDVIQAADRLDAARVKGPFSLVLAPSLYNQLFRKWEGSDVLALDHIKRLAAGGIYKAHVLEDTGVLVSPDLGPIVCAQDLSLSFLDVRESTLRFAITSALIVRLDNLKAACVLARD